MADVNWTEYLSWEKASMDTIDVKRCYVDIAGDLIAGVLLSQIVFWYLPDKDGKSKLRVQHDGYYWIAKRRTDWWDECRVSERQVDRALDILENKGLIERTVRKFNGEPTTHIRIIPDAFLSALEFGINETVITKSRNGDNEITKSLIPVTETTTETTTENTTSTRARENSQKRKNDITFDPLPPGYDEITEYLIPLMGDLPLSRFKCEEIAECWRKWPDRDVWLKAYDYTKAWLSHKPPPNNKPNWGAFIHKLNEIATRDYDWVTEASDGNGKGGTKDTGQYANF